MRGGVAAEWGVCRAPVKRTDCGAWHAPHHNPCNRDGIRSPPPPPWPSGTPESSSTHQIRILYADIRPWRTTSNVPTRGTKGGGGDKAHKRAHARKPSNWAQWRKPWSVGGLKKAVRWGAARQRGEPRGVPSSPALFAPIFARKATATADDGGVANGGARWYELYPGRQMSRGQHTKILYDPTAHMDAPTGCLTLDGRPPRRGLSRGGGCPEVAGRADSP